MQLTCSVFNMANGGFMSAMKTKPQIEADRPEKPQPYRKLKTKQKGTAAALAQAPSEATGLLTEGDVATPDVQQPVLGTAEIIPLPEGPDAKPQAANSGRFQDSDGDDAVLLRAWLERYTTFHNPVLPSLSLQRSEWQKVLDPQGNQVRRKDGSKKVKQVVVNRDFVCWLEPGDEWGELDPEKLEKGLMPRVDPQGKTIHSPTRLKYEKRAGISKSVRLRLEVNNLPEAYSGEPWSYTMSTQAKVKGFERWDRPPTHDQLLAQHWEDLATYSDTDTVMELTGPYVGKARSQVTGKALAGLQREKIWKSVRTAACWGPTDQDYFIEVEGKKRIAMTLDQIAELESGLTIEDRCAVEAYRAKVDSQTVIEAVPLNSEPANDIPWEGDEHISERLIEKLQTGREVARGKLYADSEIVVEVGGAIAKAREKGTQSLFESWKYGWFGPPIPKHWIPLSVPTPKQLTNLLKVRHEVALLTVIKNNIQRWKREVRNTIVDRLFLNVTTAREVKFRFLEFDFDSNGCEIRNDSIPQSNRRVLDQLQHSSHGVVREGVFRSYPDSSPSKEKAWAKGSIKMSSSGKPYREVVSVIPTQILENKAELVKSCVFRPFTKLTIWDDTIRWKFWWQAVIISGSYSQEEKAALMKHPPQDWELLGVTLQPDPKITSEEVDEGAPRPEPKVASSSEPLPKVVEKKRYQPLVLDMRTGLLVPGGQMQSTTPEGAKQGLWKRFKDAMKYVEGKE